MQNVLKYRWAGLLLALVAVYAWAIDIGAMPNPSNYVAAFGSQRMNTGKNIQYWSSTGDKQVCTGTCHLDYVFNATGTSITVTFYDDGDGTCSSNQRTGTITLTNGAQPLMLGGDYANGICMTVAGTNPTVTTSSMP